MTSPSLAPLEETIGSGIEAVEVVGRPAFNLMEKDTREA
jgi:hypothetical protein